MKASLVFIPGLGADHRLFAPQRKVFGSMIVPSWMVPEKRETLEHYSKRWADHLKLPSGCVLVGVSFGGMVALEMAKWVKPEAVILIGSCRSPGSVPVVLRFAGFLPGWPWIGKFVSRAWPSLSGWILGAQTKDQEDLLLKMFRETPDDFLKWAVEALRSWKGNQDAKIKCSHIHGQTDRLIPARNVKADSIVAGGGHLISLTHPEQVNAFIKGCSK